MIAILWDCFREAIYRKVFLFMVAAALLVTVFEIYNIRFVTQPDGKVMVRYHGFQKLLSGANVVSNEIDILYGLAEGPWMFFSMFLLSPLVCTFLEKGSVELAFTKGISRKTIYLSRLVGAFLVYSIPMFLFNVLPVAYFALHVELNLARYVDSVLLQMFVFAGTFVIMAATALSQRGQATVIIAGFAFFMLCNMMETRFMLGLEGVFWKRFLFNWMTLAWFVLPKPHELTMQAKQFMNDDFTSWFALATSAVFIVVAAFLTVSSLQKKSF